MNKIFAIVIFFISTSSYTQELWLKSLFYENDTMFFKIEDAINFNDLNWNIILVLQYGKADYETIYNEKDLKKLKKIKNLAGVEITDNIKYLPRSFKKNKLHYLAIVDSEMEKIPFKRMNPTIKHLRYNAGVINSIEGISRLKNLEVLNLGNNNFDNLEEEIYLLDSLNILHIGANPLTKLNLDLCRFKNLEILYMGRSYVNTLPKGINCLGKNGVINLEFSNMLKFSSKELEGINLRRFIFNEDQLIDSLLDLRKVLGNDFDIRCLNIFGSKVDVPLIEE